MQLGYILNPVAEGFSFQVTKQSPEVDAFLANNVFMSKKTGMKILASKKPEIKITKNQIFLRGSDMSEDNNIDVTKTGSDHYTKGFISQVDDTISEFVDHLKTEWIPKNYGTRTRYPRYSESDNREIVLG